jgi:hypothetical protein
MLMRMMLARPEKNSQLKLTVPSTPRSIARTLSFQYTVPERLSALRSYG